MRSLTISVFCSFLFTAGAAPFVTMNDVTWHTLGSDENNSMPIGNGDLAANVWTEQNGDIVLLVAKGDAWSENGQLLKLGRVRVHLTPSPFVGVADYAQTLKLESGELDLQAGQCRVRIWADANHPVLRIEVNSDSPVQLQASAELWRTNQYHLNQHAVQQEGFFELGSDPDGLTFDPDTVFPQRDNQVSCCHFNSRSIYPLVFEKEHLESLLPKYPDPLLHRCFGLTMAGTQLRASDDRTLHSVKAAKSFRLDLCALTEQVGSPEPWRSDLARLVQSIESVPVEKARQAHQQWWEQFWNRSWLHVEGSPDAAKVSQSYIMQRYMTACAGRSGHPIKFNGSLFTVGHDLPDGARSSEKSHDPDYRAWGASYWNQNTRMIYWPLIASGDFDLLMPWFSMYVQDLPLAKDRTRAYFHHDGGAFIETIYFWGLPNLNDFGWNNAGPELESSWMRYHVQGGLEMLAQMLDYYDYSGDTHFLKESLLPFANTVVTYYDQHWKRAPDGKINFAPAQSIETYQLTAVNPTPDIAGLMNTLPRLLSLPEDVGGGDDRALWKRVLKDLPAVPMGRTAHGKLPPQAQGEADGTPVILPAEHYDKTCNSENPELYTVFPYHLYGVGKPGLELARDTYQARLFHMAHCWGQDPVEAALLGLTDSAKQGVISELTCYGNQQFPWFWRKNNDWIPDMDNGGGGMITLQMMLMQCDGKRILLLPAWPQDWTADFKLLAPYRTTVSGHVENGKVERLVVSPPERSHDVTIVAQ